jgi:hypothetical protein
MARWIIASLAFLAIGWLDLRYGHTVALGVLIALLLVVAVFGGHCRRPGRGGDNDLITAAPGEGNGTDGGGADGSAGADAPAGDAAP